MAAFYLVSDARVIAGNDSSITVQAQPVQSCGGCAMRSGCNPGSHNATVMEVALSGSAKSYQFRHGAVELAVAPAKLLRAALSCYLQPAVLMVLGAAAGHVVAPSQTDLAAGIGAISGLAVGCWLLRLYHSRVSHPTGRANARLTTCGAAVRVILD